MLCAYFPGYFIKLLELLTPCQCQPEFFFIIYLFLVKQLTSGAWWDCIHPRQSHVSMLDLNPFTALAGGNKKKINKKIKTPIH